MRYLDPSARLGFLLNLLEVGAFFAVVYLAVGCSVAESSWRLTYELVGASFTLDIPSQSREGLRCIVLAHMQLVQASVLILLILAAVVGSITRPRAAKGAV